jgi:hypothetical protein
MVVSPTISAVQRTQIFQRHWLPQRKKVPHTYGTATNIYEIDRAGRSQSVLCFVPTRPLAAGDVMLAQKIALETDEWSALAVAKRFVPSWH